jgi:hypothetical protein
MHWHEQKSWSGQRDWYVRQDRSLLWGKCGRYVDFRWGTFWQQQRGENDLIGHSLNDFYNIHDAAPDAEGLIEIILIPLADMVVYPNMVRR